MAQHESIHEIIQVNCMSNSEACAAETSSVPSRSPQLSQGESSSPIQVRKHNRKVILITIQVSIASSTHHPRTHCHWHVKQRLVILYLALSFVRATLPPSSILSYSISIIYTKPTMSYLCSSRKQPKEERRGLTRVPQLSRRPKSWILFLMGRYTNYYGARTWRWNVDFVGRNEHALGPRLLVAAGYMSFRKVRDVRPDLFRLQEEDKLPEGMVCTGYDAGTGRRYYRDMKDGSVWVGAPYVEYGVMNKVLDTSKTSPKEDNRRFQRKIFNEESEDEKEGKKMVQGSRATTKSNSLPTTITSRDSQRRKSTGVSSETTTLVAPEVPFSTSQDEETRLITAIESTPSLNLPTSPTKSTASRRKRRDKRTISEPLSPISVATSPSTYSQDSQWSKSDYKPNASEVQLRATEIAPTIPRADDDGGKGVGSREGGKAASLLSPISVAKTPSVYRQQSGSTGPGKQQGHSVEAAPDRHDDRVDHNSEAPSSPESTPTNTARTGDFYVETGSKLAQKKSSETQYRSSFASSSTNASPTINLTPEQEHPSAVPFPSSSPYPDLNIIQYSRPLSSASAATSSTVTITPVTARTSISMSSTVTMFASPHSETSPLLLHSERSPRGPPSEIPLVPRTPPGLGPLSPRSISIYPETPSALGHGPTLEDFSAHERLFASSTSTAPLLGKPKPAPESPLPSLQSPALLHLSGLDSLPSPPSPVDGPMNMHALLPSEQLRALSSQRRVEIEKSRVTAVHQTPEHLGEGDIFASRASRLAEKSSPSAVVEVGGNLDAEQPAGAFPGFSLNFESGPELSLGFEVGQKEGLSTVSNNRAEPVVELPSRPKPTQPPSLSRRESMSIEAASQASGEHVRIDTMSGVVGGSSRVKIGAQHEKKPEMPKRKSMFRRVSDLLGKGK
ncbi:hypothetical protein BJ165DRAFT_1597139 [Panaeolus papilionaceus]|nr:hypothetical protein BJ165DRAFT_1597139 [Panaeolus papilionaceus]